MKIKFTIAVVLGTIGLWAQKPIYTKANLESARVYYDGAELTQNAEVKLPKGMSEVVITNISNELKENTIKVGSTDDVTVMSVQFSNAYIEEYDNVNNSPLTKPLRDSIAAVELELEKITNSINADLKIIQLLENSSDSYDKESSLKISSVAEMAKWVDYYGEKYKNLQNGIYLKKKEKEIIEAKWNDLKSKLALGSDKSEKISQGKLIVQIMNAQEGKIPFKINYATSRAQWIPSYDLRIEKVGEPVKMIYKAQVVQTSGIDWRNVKLSLTSGNINQNNTMPNWYNWFIQYEPLVNNDKTDEIVISTGYGSSRRGGSGVVSRINASELRVDGVADVNRMIEGKASGVTVTNVSAPQVSYEERKSIAEYTNIHESELNVTFDIAIPYSILSNGKRHSVDLNNFELNGDYKYYSAPKLDKTAYLVTEISDYSKHNLLPGEANVIYDGMNIGKTRLSTENTEEKLRLNIGKDPRISLERTLISDKSGTKTLSSKKEQNFVYEITVKNNKKEAVDIQLEDQFPISTDNSIEVTLSETSGAETDEEKGLLKWNLKLNAGETKKVRFGYQIRFNKDRNIIGF